MQTCEVLIVGGGPAGSSCAGRLVQEGLDVLVIDRKTFPRDKTCAGWVTPQVFDVLEVDPADYANSHVCQPITAFRTGMIGGEELATDYGRVVSYGIRRCEFDHFLLERSGAPRRFGETVEAIRRDGSDWVINDAIRAKMLIGAGGHFCPVARALGGREGKQIITVAAQEVEFELRPEDEACVNIRAEVPELYFCEDLAGYAWCFRKGNFLNVGLGRLNRRDVTAHLQSFCQLLRERQKIACDLPERFHGHAYQIYERLEPKLVDDGVLFIGDAAGLAYPQSGEGIRPAVESGLLAADVLIEARGKYSLAGLTRYASEIHKRFGSPRRGAVSDYLPAAFLRFAAARLMANRWFTRNVILDRWFLHAADPALTVKRPEVALAR
jgi:geranylgeranyl reductase family protein